VRLLKELAVRIPSKEARMDKQYEIRILESGIRMTTDDILAIEKETAPPAESDGLFARGANQHSIQVTCIRDHVKGLTSKMLTLRQELLY
jgi:hypothetical protein